MSTLSLKKFDISPDAQPGEDVVHVVGRQSGLVAFILSIMKVDPVTEIRCNDERIEVTQSSFFGRETITVPLAATTGIIGGYKKPKALVYAMLFIFAAGIALADTLGSNAVIAAFVIDVVLFGYYIFYKEMSLYVQNGGDKMWGLSFKRSVIENVPVDIDRVNDAIRLINWKVLAIHKGQ